MSRRNVEVASLGTGEPMDLRDGPVTMMDLAETHCDSVAHQWIVLHTRSRQEKAVATALEAMGTRCFLPLVKATRYYGKRKAMVEVPLFSSYVFLHGTLEQAYEIDRTKRVAQIIPVVDQQRIEWELKNLQQALELNVPLDPYPYLREGVRVEVRSGPFRGMQGVVESRLNMDRLILQVDTLGRAVSMEIDGALLDVIE